MSLPSQTLESWVRIPLEAWICVYVFAFFSLCIILAAVQGIMSVVCEIQVSELVLNGYRPDSPFVMVTERETFNTGCEKA
jgi:hypothetical protein